MVVCGVSDCWQRATIKVHQVWRERLAKEGGGMGLPLYSVFGCKGATSGAHSRPPYHSFREQTGGTGKARRLVLVRISRDNAGRTDSGPIFVAKVTGL